MFDEQKLRWMNGRYVRELALDDLTARLEALTGRSGLRDAVAITQEKISTLDEFWPLARAFFDDPVDDPAAREKFLAPEAGAEALAVARAALDGRAGAVEPRVGRGGAARAVERSGMKAKQVFQPLRVALTGTHDLAGHLRDGRADRPRQGAGAHRRGARRRAAAPDRPLFGHSLPAQPFVHCCR